MRIKSDWRVTFAAVTALAAPDAANPFLTQFSSAIEVCVRLGQVGVAIVTIFYIYRKWKNAKKEVFSDGAALEQVQTIVKELVKK